MDIKEAIHGIKLFNCLNNFELELLASISHTVKYDASSVLFYESDSTDKLLFLVSGLLKVYKIDKFDNEIFLYYIYPNSMISELSNLTDSKIFCFSNSEFLKESVILSIDFKKFKEQFLTKNEISLRFMDELIYKNQQLQCIVNRELVFDATSKVAFMLSNDLEMFNELKRSEVSVLLHIQPETLLRVLKRLTRNGAIAIEKGEVSIVDREKLKNIYLGV
ncbi:MAG: Crp/Fnr family transcriptional regulator [Campylobacterales bacterium]|nr:Crp/Fnr family transcriptional regulator [Campylobacterales bacterium]